jgi:hypothetical protein
VKLLIPNLVSCEPSPNSSHERPSRQSLPRPPRHSQDRYNSIVCKTKQNKNSTTRRLGIPGSAAKRNAPSASNYSVQLSASKNTKWPGFKSWRTHLGSSKTTMGIVQITSMFNLIPHHIYQVAARLRIRHVFTADIVTEGSTDENLKIR